MARISVGQIAKEINTKGFIEIPNFLSMENFASLKKVHVSKKISKIGSHVIHTATHPLQYKITNQISKALNMSFKSLFIICKHGDFTLLNSPILKPFRGLLDLSDHWNPHWGGYLSFIKNEREVLRRNPSPNSLFLYNIAAMPFIKYVNTNAKKQAVKYLFLR